MESIQEERQQLLRVVLCIPNKRRGIATHLRLGGEREGEGTVCIHGHTKRIRTAEAATVCSPNLEVPWSDAAELSIPHLL